MRSLTAIVSAIALSAMCLQFVSKGPAPQPVTSVQPTEVAYVSDAPSPSYNNEVPVPTYAKRSLRAAIRFVSQIDDAGIAVPSSNAGPEVVAIPDTKPTQAAAQPQQCVNGTCATGTCATGSCQTGNCQPQGQRIYSYSTSSYAIPQGSYVVQGGCTGGGCTGAGSTGSYRVYSAAPSGCSGCSQGMAYAPTTTVYRSSSYQSSYSSAQPRRYGVLGLRARPTLLYRIRSNIQARRGCSSCYR